MNLIKTPKTLFLMTAGLTKHLNASSQQSISNQARTIYDFSAQDIDGNNVSLSKYENKVVLIVNVATYWSLTNINYAELNQLHEKYSPDLAILAFPANLFTQQEPGTNEQIKKFAVEKKGAKFDMFAKVDVNGESAIPLYKYLREQKPGWLSDAIKTNFTKFLVNKKGVCVARFAPTTSPLKIEPDIQKLLAE